MEPTILILLAEDESLIGLNLQDALEEGGYAVHYVASGKDAMASVERNEPILSGIITDIRIGGGPDGWEIARRGAGNKFAHPHYLYVWRQCTRTWLTGRS